jgi:hypothetical protein
MRKLLKSGGAAALSLLVGMSAADAQVTSEGMGKIVPVHLYACNFNDGQNMSDMNNVIERWNEFMDEQGVDSYAAWTLVPYHYGGDQMADVLWLGAYRDGNAMGEGTDMWLTAGGDLAADFAEVATCQAHLGFSSAMYKAPPSGNTPDSGILEMSNCKMKDGVRYSDVRSAEIEWAEYMNENDSRAATYHWFPTHGGGDQDFNYKIVSAYENYTQYGKDWEHGANGGGRAVSVGLFGDLDDCDDARVYVATSIRAAGIRE